MENMLSPGTYVVKDGDEFDGDNYPALLGELTQINKGAALYPDAYKADILISFTKNHALQMEWIKANPEFARMVTCGAFPTAHIESLFSASTANTFFQQRFEHFLQRQLHP